MVSVGVVVVAWVVVLVVVFVVVGGLSITLTTTDFGFHRDRYRGIVIPGISSVEVISCLPSVLGVKLAVTSKEVTYLSDIGSPTWPF